MSMALMALRANAIVAGEITRERIPQAFAGAMHGWFVLR